MHMKEFSAPVASFRLAAALDKYELDLRALAESWFDGDVLRRMQQEFGQMRLLGAALPRLSVAWIAVQVSRTRFLEALCSYGAPVASALQEHLAAVQGLRGRCLRLIGAQGPTLA